LRLLALLLSGGDREKYDAQYDEKQDRKPHPAESTHASAPIIPPLNIVPPPNIVPVPIPPPKSSNSKAATTNAITRAVVVFMYEFPLRG
jgi:hypothetical protein